jgi:hypothetical protein
MVLVPAIRALNRNNYSPFEFIGSAWKTPSDEQRTLHLIQIGFGKAGQGLGLRMAELCHFSNGIRLRMTILDRQMNRKVKEFRSNYPGFSAKTDGTRRVLGSLPAVGQASRGKWTDENQSVYWGHESDLQRGVVATACNATFDKLLEVTDQGLISEVEKLSRGDGATAVIVCGEDGKENFLSAEILSARFRQLSIRCPVFAWLGGARGFTGIANDRVDYSEAIPFGLCMSAVNYDEVVDGSIEWLAKWLNYAYEQKWGETRSQDWQLLQTVFARIMNSGCGVVLSPEELIAFGNVQKDIEICWQNLAKTPSTCEDFRHSNLSAAAHAIVKLASVDLQIEGHHRELSVPRLCGSIRDLLLKLRQTSLPAAMEHNRWMAERLLRGWTYGSKKDNTAKKHPDLITWETMRKHEAANRKASKETEKDCVAVDVLIDLCLAGLLVVRPS